MQFVKMTSTANYGGKARTYYLNLDYISIVEMTVVTWDSIDETTLASRYTDADGICVRQLSSGITGGDYLYFKLTDEGVSILLDLLEKTAFREARID